MSASVRTIELFEGATISDKKRILTIMLDILRAYNASGNFKPYSDDLITLMLDIAQHENNYSESALKENLSIDKITQLSRHARSLPDNLKTSLNKYLSNLPEFDESRERQPIKTLDIHDYLKLMVNCALRDWFKVEKQDILLFNTQWVSTINTVTNPLLNSTIGAFWKKNTVEQSNLKFKPSIQSLDIFEDSWLQNPEFLQLYTIIQPHINQTFYLSDIVALLLTNPDIYRSVVDKLQELFYLVWQNIEISEAFNQNS